MRKGLGFRVIDEKEPLTLNEAKTCELPNKSKLAMQVEIKALPANNGSCGTAYRKARTNKWVYMVKNSDGQSRN